VESAMKLEKKARKVSKKAENVINKLNKNTSQASTNGLSKEDSLVGETEEQTQSDVTSTNSTVSNEDRSNKQKYVLENSSNDESLSSLKYLSNIPSHVTKETPTHEDNVTTTNESSFENSLVGKIEEKHKSNTTSINNSLKYITNIDRHINKDHSKEHSSNSSDVNRVSTKHDDSNKTLSSLKYLSNINRNLTYSSKNTNKSDNVKKTKMNEKRTDDVFIKTVNALKTLSKLKRNYV